MFSHSAEFPFGAPGEVYHIAGTAELTNLQLTRRLLDALGVGWDRVENVRDRKGHDRRYSLTDAKLQALGYAPQVDFEDGLAATVRWYADNRDWWEPFKKSTGPSPASTAGSRHHDNTDRPVALYQDAAEA